jgi:endo-1,4-beta-xylanase
MLTRRSLLATAPLLTLSATLACAAPGVAAIPAPAAPKRRIPYGSASMIQTFRADPRYREALAKHCDIIVPMNCLKMEQLRHDRARFDTGDADEQIAFARQNGKMVRGHTLVWHNALPPWVKTISTRAEAERELTHHIRTVVSRFRGKVPSWDVVNEVIADDSSKGSPWRPSIWLERLGPDYIDLAFRTAAEADPAAQLVINDYNLEGGEPDTIARRRTLLNIVKRLKDKGIPIHGVGLQGHLYAEKQIDTAGLSRFVSDIAAMGLEVMVTELDVIDWRLPADIPGRDRQAARQVTTFLEAIAVAKLPSSVVTWGMSDRYSWVSDVFKRDDRLPPRPLPFDAEYSPKPMWQAIEAFCAAKA